jgi:membrane-bound metal-dependent hydrolase YbcI (DUF457 family)
LIFLIPGIILWIKEKHKLAVVFFILTFGVLFHCFLDYLLGGGRMEGIMWFYPFSTEAYKVHLFLSWGFSDYGVGLDAILLLLWLFHEERKHHITDFF